MGEILGKTGEPPGGRRARFAPRPDANNRERSLSMSDQPMARLRNRWRRWGAARRRARGMVGRRPRLRVEGLEDRALLASITEYPIPSKAGSANQIIAGPDGNLWFTEND